MTSLGLLVYVIGEQSSLSEMFHNANKVVEFGLPNDVKAGNVAFDYKSRSWVNDTELMQFRCWSTGSEWEPLYDAATHIINRLSDQCGDKLYGATILLPTVGNPDAQAARDFAQRKLDIDGPLISDKDGKVTLDLYRKSDFRDRFGQSVLVVSADSPLSDEDTHRWLSGIDCYVMQAEILAHKVSWIGRQVLFEPTHSDLKAEMKKILGIVRETSELLRSGNYGGVLLQAPELHLRNADLLAVVATSITNLLPQLEHLKYFATHSPVKQLHAGYLRSAESVLSQVKHLHTELLHSSQSLSRILGAAKSYSEFIHAAAIRAREMRIKRAQRWIASLGVGIASAEVASENFVRGVMSSQAPSDWWSVFLLRTAIVVSLTTLTCFSLWFFGGGDDKA